MDILFLIYFVVSIALFLVVWYAQQKNLQKYARQIESLQQVNNELLQKIQDLKKLKEKTQRAVIKGQLAERFFPVFSEKYNPSDMRFLGDPIDYIIFSGYTEEKDGYGSAIEIIFAEVKTGKSRLNSTQRKIMDAVQNKRVRWETIYMNDKDYCDHTTTVDL